MRQSEVNKYIYTSVSNSVALHDSQGVCILSIVLATGKHWIVTHRRTIKTALLSECYFKCYFTDRFRAPFIDGHNEVSNLLL